MCLWTVLIVLDGVWSNFLLSEGEREWDRAQQKVQVEQHPDHSLRYPAAIQPFVTQEYIPYIM